MIISEIWFFVVIFMKFMFIELWSGRLNCFRASFSCFACIFSDLSFFTITFWIFRVLFSSSCARNMIFVFRSVILCVQFDRSDFLSWIVAMVYVFSFGLFVLNFGISLSNCKEFIALVIFVLYFYLCSLVMLGRVYIWTIELCNHSLLYVFCWKS